MLFRGYGSLVIFILAILLFCTSGSQVAAGFEIPEKLLFDLTWTGVKAGTASLEILNDRDSIRIVSTANSAPWVSVFYTVEDRIEAVLSKSNTSLFAGVPKNYKVKIREGRHRRDKEVVFDYEKLRAVYTDHLKGEKRDLDIQKNTLDPLSSFYYIRTLKVEVGKPAYVNIFDNKKMWDVEVQILRKERITTPLGTFDTIVIKPLMQSEGIFSRKGDMHIWLTDDSRRIPVRMQTKVGLGSVIATLTGGKF